MLTARIAVLVSGGGTNLQALLDTWKAGKMPHGAIALVVADKEGIGAIRRAQEAEVPFVIIPRREAGFEERLGQVLAAYEIDMVVLAGFLRILSGDFIRAFGKPILNIHPSLIPSFCGKGFYGLKVHQAALERGVKLTGATVHYVNDIPDGGEIIAQKAVEVLPGDTPEVLQRRVMEQAEWKLLPAAAEEVARKLVEKG